MSEIKDSFNKIKNILYKKNEETRSLIDLVEFIQKPIKTEEDIKLIKRLKSYTDRMIQCINDLGTKSIVLNTKIEEFQEGLDIDNDLDIQVKEIILIIDQFVDGLSVLIRTFDFKTEYFQLKRSEYYIKSYRSNLIKKLHEFNLKTQINKEDEKTILILINDIIDVVIKESSKLRLKKMNEVLSREYSEDG
jgi:hypothetical protein